MKLLKEFFNKYKSAILYLFFGGCTTLVNIICYYILYNLIATENVTSTAIAWIVSVLFAFLTNRKYVFNSSAVKSKDIIYEVLSFFTCRLLTGILDIAIMYFAVDCYNMNGLIWKIISNILVIIINYFASKILIFKK